jgi:predicted phosphodiesterase
MENFRVAILADIHGNAQALLAVLDDLKHQTLNRVVFAGDLVMNGPRPEETIACIMDLNYPGVLGNTDQYVIDGEDIVAAWTSAHIGPEQVDYLRTLPVSQRICPPVSLSPEDDLLVVHSTPRSVEDLLLFSLCPDSTNFTQLTPADEALDMLNGAEAGMIVYGHIHYFSKGTIGTQRVESVGSVGFPFDSDPRPAYAIAQWDGGQWEIEARRVAYDHEMVARQIEDSGIPFAPRFARMIREARWLPRRGS